MKAFKLSVLSTEIKKIIVDGKELDLSKIKSIRVNVDCDGIDIDVELSWFGLPYKI